MIRKINMHLKFVIFAFSLSATLAYPLHRDTREAAWAHAKVNKVHDRTDPTKDVAKIYKSIIDSSSLYKQEDEDIRNPVLEEMQRKLTMESERLRVRLRQELAELRERLSPSPAHLSATLASMRERLTPLTQQFQSSFSSNTQDLCSQLSLYLQGLEAAEAQTEASPTLYQEAFHWISQSLQHSNLQLANIINDFHTTASGEIEHLKQWSVTEGEATHLKVWQEMSSRLGQEVNSIREEVQNRVEAIKAKLATLLESAQPHRAEVTVSLEQFCQNAALQSQALLARMERVFMVVEEDINGAFSLSPDASLSLHKGDSLEEDFSVKLSALIQDILHSVQ